LHEFPEKEGFGVEFRRTDAGASADIIYVTNIAALRNADHSHSLYVAN